MQKIVWYLTLAYIFVTASKTKSVLSAELGCTTGEYAIWCGLAHVLRQRACESSAR